LDNVSNLANNSSLLTKLNNNDTTANNIYNSFNNIPELPLSGVLSEEDFYNKLNSGKEVKMGG
jgi:hypothetical protein